MRSQYTDYHPLSIYAFGKFAKSQLAKLIRGDRFDNMKSAIATLNNTQPIN
ncbi:hypothetical protein [Nodularia chucula]|uniref:hypothetical protein n=1 Tax=Nodularia chucula TaxID=3093667 RepID=UPI0039C6505D